MTIRGELPFTVKDEVHEKGNASCNHCRGWATIPEKCECGGLIHAELIDEDWDEETKQESLRFLNKCDLCGNEFENIDS